jgi:hypothetical protein
MTHLIQIDDEIREATAEEIAEIEAIAAKEADNEAALAKKAEDKAVLLERLGITEDEAKLLLG